MSNKVEAGIIGSGNEGQQPFDEGARGPDPTTIVARDIIKGHSVKTAKAKESKWAVLKKPFTFLYNTFFAKHSNARVLPTDSDTDPGSEDDSINGPSLEERVHSPSLLALQQLSKEGKDLISKRAKLKERKRAWLPKIFSKRSAEANELTRKINDLNIQKLLTVISKNLRNLPGDFESLVPSNNSTGDNFQDKVDLIKHYSDLVQNLDDGVLDRASTGEKYLYIGLLHCRMTAYDIETESIESVSRELKPTIDKLNRRLNTEEKDELQVFLKENGIDLSSVDEI